MEINYNELLDKANELYLKSKTIDCNSISPINWLYNQDKLRSAWEFFVEKSKNLGPFESIIMDNEFTQYMRFMYNSFPVGYGEIIKKEAKSKITAYDRNKEWRKNNPEKYKEQNKRKYLNRKARKEAAAAAAQQAV
jgi:hypothetical protein